MKKLSIVLSAVIVSLSLGLMSCQTTDSIIPGKKAVQIDNIYAEYYNIAEIYFSLEKYDKAASFYEASMDGKKNTNQAYYKLGRCKAYLGKWSEAETIYSDMLKQDPENSSLQSAIAYIYAQQGKSKEALEIYTKLMKAEADNVVHLQNALSVYLMEKDLDNSKALFAQYEKDFPEDSKLDKFKSEIEKLDKELNPDAESSEAPDVKKTTEPDPDAK